MHQHPNTRMFLLLFFAGLYIPYDSTPITVTICHVNIFYLNIFLKFQFDTSIFFRLYVHSFKVTSDILKHLVLANLSYQILTHIPASVP